MHWQLIEPRTFSHTFMSQQHQCEVVVNKKKKRPTDYSISEFCFFLRCDYYSTNEMVFLVFRSLSPHYLTLFWLGVEQIGSFHRVCSMHMCIAWKSKPQMFIFHCHNEVWMWSRSLNTLFAVNHLAVWNIFQPCFELWLHMWK